MQNDLRKKTSLPTKFITTLSSENWNSKFSNESYCTFDVSECTLRLNKTNFIFVVSNGQTFNHERPQNSFLGWANDILDWAKDYFNTFDSRILIQISYLEPEISQMSNSWTGQVPSLAHWCGRPWIIHDLKGHNLWYHHLTLKEKA